ncbi:hypothetical protein GGR58DRAFT_527973 [Xylaria digitata]|nr:hypothetical protein GGR58DRAFT_527973 [Xylaria digitata]
MTSQPGDRAQDNSLQRRLLRNIRDRHANAKRETPLIKKISRKKPCDVIIHQLSDAEQFDSAVRLFTRLPSIRGLAGLAPHVCHQDRDRLEIQLQYPSHGIWRIIDRLHSRGDWLVASDVSFLRIVHQRTPVSLFLPLLDIFDLNMCIKQDANTVDWPELERDTVRKVEAQFQVFESQRQSNTELDPGYTLNILQANPPRQPKLSLVVQQVGRYTPEFAHYTMENILYAAVLVHAYSNVIEVDFSEGLLQLDCPSLVEPYTSSEDFHLITEAYREALEAVQTLYNAGGKLGREARWFLRDVHSASDDEKSSLRSRYLTIGVAFKAPSYDGKVLIGTQRVGVQVDNYDLFVYPLYTFLDDPCANEVLAQDRIRRMKSTETCRFELDHMSHCLNDHSVFPKPPQVRLLPTRVIDCTDSEWPRLYITGGDVDGSYVTLSYVWGENQPNKTRRDNLDGTLVRSVLICFLGLHGMQFGRRKHSGRNIF